MDLHWMRLPDEGTLAETRQTPRGAATLARSVPLKSSARRGTQEQYQIRTLSSCRLHETTCQLMRICRWRRGRSEQMYGMFRIATLVHCSHKC